MSTNHIAAIHVLKAQLGLSDDDYRALLLQLTGVSSSREMTQPQRAQVREHLQRLAVRMGVAPQMPERPFAQRRAEPSPRERKVLALWGQLHCDGVVRDGSVRALNAFVRRTVHVDALGWCNGAQLDVLIEALKQWVARGERHA